MNAQTLPKWIYYAAANFGVVGMTLLTPLSLLGPRLPRALGVVLLIVCLIAANLAAWGVSRARARLALATTDQAVANRPIRSRTRMIQLALIGLGLTLLALTMFAPSSGQGDRIFGTIGGFFGIGYGIVFGIKRKPKNS
jgi:hypothetical protein